ncbi:hypothetical protein D5S18_14830 [Nocardia panacis]|uniref:Lipoprotein n=1 Tax=Nocardia panacis TaxID=2340916 RepID=A0A3A4K9T4_9NOCA|nr:hypothetical protein [Nocardia panacis]RJO74735.1 hypothetical protein D5S18_14830 [Nocardia panacis]
MRRSAPLLASATLAALLTSCSGSTPAPPTPDRVPTGHGPMDPTWYQAVGGYFFHTADRGLSCGILDEAVGQSRHSAGCQGSTPPPPEMQACWNSAPDAAAMAVGESASYLCVNQGLFVGPPEDGGGQSGGQVLPAGASLTVHGFTCQTEQMGVSCRNDVSGHGFTMTPGTNRLF